MRSSQAGVAAGRLTVILRRLLDVAGAHLLQVRVVDDRRLLQVPPGQTKTRSGRTLM